ncbi:MAG TPA: CaiB/BaiF CoA-transferase family protein [Candidatus Binatia bacterium]|jgi:crotonobetainyl-CoA:carnitine CoA-transferase CaiB-like acyl-CoA transferase|nr:CaiB/BaiF CoA-transferase family protein [Candidatus Binatia bacterium]
MPLALSRFRMLDLSRQLPGPYCSMLLADLGMDVVSVCAPADPMGIGIPPLARNKRSLTLNLKAPEGRAIFHRLAKDADVVLEGSRPGAAARLGVDWETLRELNPRIIYCSISGYGQDGPYRDRVGHDVNYLGFAGVIGLTGPAGGPPAIPGVQVADIGGGSLTAAVGILAALLAREETGAGQFVDIAMMDGVVAWQVINALRYFVDGAEPARGDTYLTGHHPCYALYETKDGRHVTVGALEPHFWRTLCERLGHPELAAKQFAEGAEREEMFRVLRARFRERTMAEWVAELADLDVCFGPVAKLSEALADPQVRHRRMVIEMPDERGVARRTLGNPVKLSATPPAFRTPPATLGQHTDEILASLGYSPADVAGLRARGVV